MPLIAQRRSDPRLNEQLDILALLMCARGENGEVLSDSEIRDDVITLMLAGHETTATTLAWAFDLLLHHPDALQRVREEAVNGEEEFTTSGSALSRPPRCSAAHDSPAPNCHSHPLASSDEWVSGGTDRLNSLRSHGEATRVPARVRVRSPLVFHSAGHQKRDGWILGRVGRSRRDSAYPLVAVGSTGPLPNRFTAKT
jgi:hypothetical protein